MHVIMLYTTYYLHTSCRLVKTYVYHLPARADDTGTDSCARKVQVLLDEYIWSLSNVFC